MSHIISNPAILSGKPVIRGTRISVENILDYFVAGLSIDDILNEYPNLKRTHVLACLDFVKKNYSAPFPKKLVKI
jgi:uncharacterized protein (DUF433 family)